METRKTENEYLSELFQIRMTPIMKSRIEKAAEHLGVRPVDIARMALALYLHNNSLYEYDDDEK